MKNNRFYISFILFLPVFIMNGMSNFVLMGPPGAGKGTFANMLVENFNHVQICPGALLRAEALKNTVLGNSIKDMVLSGRPVAASILWDVVQLHLEDALAKNKYFILDGFPKNQEAFDLFVAFLSKHQLQARYIYFYANDNICIERMTTRLECHTCDATFNLVSKQPKKAGICDFCQNDLVQRKGDDRATAVYRLQDFHQNIEPVIENIKKVCMVQEVETSAISICDSKKLHETLIK